MTLNLSPFWQPFDLVRRAPPGSARFAAGWGKATAADAAEGGPQQGRVSRSRHFACIRFFTRAPHPQVLTVSGLTKQMTSLIALSEGRRAETAISARRQGLPAFRVGRGTMTGFGKVVVAATLFLVSTTAEAGATPISWSAKQRPASGALALPSRPVFLVDADKAALQNASAMPLGASSLQETYRDWLVVCSQNDGGKEPLQGECVVHQQQVRKETEQRILAVEVRREGGLWMATLALPFGLSLQPGVRLQFDDAPPSGAYPFITCLPSGCLVHIKIDEAQVAALQTGKLLKLITVAAGGEETIFTVPLGGFAEASQRLVSLQHQWPAASKNGGDAEQ